MDITILSLKLKKLFNTGQSLQIPSRPKIIFVCPNYLLLL